MVTVLETFFAIFLYLALVPIPRLYLSCVTFPGFHVFSSFSSPSFFARVAKIVIDASISLAPFSNVLSTSEMEETSRTHRYTTDPFQLPCIKINDFIKWSTSVGIILTRKKEKKKVIIQTNWKILFVSTNIFVILFFLQKRERSPGKRMDRLRRSFRDSFRRRKDPHVPESSKPHQWQADETAVRSATCAFHVKVQF